MKETTIRVLKVAPGQHPEVITLDNELGKLQEAVSIGASYTGLIEIVEINNGICVLCNEEGKLIGLEGCRRISNDIICGVFYITSEDREGNLASLTDQQIAKYRERFWEIEDFKGVDMEDYLYVEITAGFGEI